MTGQRGPLAARALACPDRPPRLEGRTARQYPAAPSALFANGKGA